MGADRKVRQERAREDPPRVHDEARRRASMRAVLEDTIRELEFESPERWSLVIEGLRGVIVSVDPA